jgi:methylenetetrahydrofolate dehydrogenase (NADP+)/methenyltetrahydrofolate cyclohydrolase
MTKILNGAELAGFIKERQARAVRGLRQAQGIVPKLAIVQTNHDPVIDTYVRLKKRYGTDILIDVDDHVVAQAEVSKLIAKLNEDPSVHGIIIQLPLEAPGETDTLLNLVDPAKDVDGLAQDSLFDPATPMAIMWLLSGFNIDLTGKQILLVGRGKLVGAPLEKLLLSSQLRIEVADRSTGDLSAKTVNADIIITATGSPAILFPDMIKQNAVVVDAGVASENGKTLGDLHPSVYDRQDLTLTPPKGGVGPLTVCALFENVITAARNQGVNGI